MCHELDNWKWPEGYWRKYKPTILYELQTEKKQLRLILQNNLVNSLMFVYQDTTELPN